MLTLVGLGLTDEYDMTLRGIEACKRADRVYIELYTGKWSGSAEGLQRVTGKEVVFLNRSDMEENSSRIIEESKRKSVVVLVQGDPMVATTHSSMLVEAKSAGVDTSIIHNSSIFSAVAETGLHVYKLGATVTIPFPEKTGGRLPKSVYDSIRDNKSRGLHTLCLLDVGQDPGIYMTPAQAVDQILVMERTFGEGVIMPVEKIVVLCRAGVGSQIYYDDIEIFQSGFLTTTPAVVIIPGKLHFTEEEFLKLFKV